MAEAMGKREKGATFMFVGLALWVADLLVIFFLPAALKSGGGRNTFFVVIAVLGAIGLVLMISGYRMRHAADRET